MVQHWRVSPTDWELVLAAVRELADAHDLRFWAHIRDDDQITIWVQFLIAGAAELAAALSDVYTVDEAAPELVALDAARYTCRLDLDWSREPELAVAADDDDNRAAWPVIVAFTNAVADRLGGSWVEP